MQALVHNFVSIALLSSLQTMFLKWERWSFTTGLLKLWVASPFGVVKNYFVFREDPDAIRDLKQSK